MNYTHFYFFILKLKVKGKKKVYIKGKKAHLKGVFIAAAYFLFAISPLPYSTGLWTEWESTKVITGALHDMASSFSAAFVSFCAFNTKWGWSCYLFLLNITPGTENVAVFIILDILKSEKPNFGQISISLFVPLQFYSVPL